MADALLALQSAVVNLLKAGSPPAFSYPVYTGRAPQSATFPYAVVGAGDSAQDWGTKIEQGQEILLNVDTWSRGTGNQSLATSMVQIKQMMAEVYAALHEAEFSVSGQQMVQCRLDFSQVIPDADGQTWHGVTRLRLFLSAA
jgi:hypothetical protein